VYNHYVSGHYSSPCSLFTCETHKVTETGFCLRFHVEQTFLGPIDRASPYLWPHAPKSKSKLKLDIILSWNKAHIWGLRPDFYYCVKVAGFLMWGALSDKRTGLPFTVDTGPDQRSHSRVRVQQDCATLFYTLSDSRLPFSSPPTARRVTVEVFDPVSTRDRHAPTKDRIYKTSTAWTICECYDKH
jgi:hypothetical protein